MGGLGTILLQNLEPGLPFPEFCGLSQRPRFSFSPKQLDASCSEEQGDVVFQAFLDPAGQGLPVQTAPLLDATLSAWLSTSSPISSP